MTPFTQPKKLKVLITGAAGNIGLCLRTHLRDRYALLRLADIADQEPAQGNEETCRFDVRDMASIERCMKDVDCVVHLAGIPGADTWEKILPMNIEGCYNVFEAARRCGVRRVIFASSNHAVGYHRREKFLDNTVQPRPDSRYGISKVFGEAVGRMYADKYGLSVACLRIGTFRTPDRPDESRQLLTWISHRDMAQLVRCCIEHESYHFVVAYGVSNNLRNRWDNSNVKFLGYRPEDDSEVFAPEILAKNIPEDPIAAQFHGGFYCPLEFVGSTDRID